MADLKISALPVATTPLAGTEVIPIVQGGVTDQVSVANLTAGRNVAVGAVVGVPRTLSVGGSTALERYAATPHVALRGGDNSTIGYEYRQNITQAQGFYVSKAVIGGSQTAHWFLQPDGNFGLLDSNVIFSTAAKGVNFTANTPAAGMTSQLLNWYEEGTFTPSIGGTATYTIQEGFYTRVGRLVYVQGKIQINAIGTGSVSTLSGLPFTVKNTPSASSGGNSVQYFSGIATAVDALAITANPNTTNCFFVGTVGTGTTAFIVNVFASSARIDFAFTYIV